MYMYIQVDEFKVYLIYIDECKVYSGRRMYKYIQIDECMILFQSTNLS